MQQLGTIKIDRLAVLHLFLLVFDSLPNTAILKLHSPTVPLNLLDILLNRLNLQLIFFEMLPKHIDLIRQFSKTFILQALSINILVLHLGNQDFSLDVPQDVHIGDHVLLFELAICLLLHIL